MFVEWICVGGPYGDCTSRYKGKIIKNITVKDFIEQEIKSEEWGIIQINGKIICKYADGELLKVNKTLLNRYLNKNIIQISSSGGWSLMDYELKVEESKEEEILIEDIKPIKINYKDGFIF